MSLPDLLRASHDEADLSAVDRLYLQRAKREVQDGGRVGRDEIRVELFAEQRRHAQRELSVTPVGPDLFAVAFGAMPGNAGEAFTRHHWLTIEQDRIAREIVVGDEAVGVEADEDSHVFRPLGERRAGRGQLAVAGQALLPDPVSPIAQAISDALHAAWNGLNFAPLRSLFGPDLSWTGPAGRKGGVDELTDWISGCLISLPACCLLFERAVQQEDRVAFLWRLVADEGERRLWMRGSTILTTANDRVVEDDTVADEAMLTQQRTRPILDL